MRKELPEVRVGRPTNCIEIPCGTRHTLKKSSFPIKHAGLHNHPDASNTRCNEPTFTLDRARRMISRPTLERWAWIAAIAGTIIALVSLLLTYFAPSNSKPEIARTLPPPATHVEQHATSGGLQIGTVGGNVVVNPAPPPAPAPEKTLAPSELSVVLPSIFKELGPGASVEKMKNLLGPPYAQGAPLSGAIRVMQNFKDFVGDTSTLPKDARKQYSYRFNDAYVQLRSEDGETISELMVLIIGPKMRANIDVYRTDVVLGKTNLAATLESNEQPHVDYSAKHHLAFSYQYSGAPGNYLHYYFGSIETMNAPAPDEEGMVNFAAVTAQRTEAPYFDWAHLQ